MARSLARPVIVISQPMYFPWVGLLEQMRLADVFVHYDDVQLTRGFFTRVQVKTAKGTEWLSVPLKDHHQGELINEAQIDDTQPWRERHIAILRQSYADAPFVKGMLSVVESVFSSRVSNLAQLARASAMALVDYFDLRGNRTFVDSSSLNIPGSSSQRLHDIAMHFGAHTYVTGHGAKNYLDHELFEKSGIDVAYMAYEHSPYPQLHGAFTPFVTSLDLIANCGREGAAHIKSGTQTWKEFVK